MNKRYGCLFLLFSYFSVNGQITFDQIPRNLQLYPRNAANQAEVIISGHLQGSGFTKLSVQVWREATLWRVVSQPIAPTASTTAFRLATTIQAEPAEYSFRVFVHQATDSTLIVERNRIVCGDVFIIYGQSNALALPGLDELYGVTFEDKYMRTAAFTTGRPSNELAWFAAKQPFGSVGGFGLTLQRLILQHYRMPTCILNGAQGGAAINDLTRRDPLNHANPATFYGQLLYRAQWAGLTSHIKAIIWKQGEAEAGSDPSDYAQSFTTLYQQLRQDYGNVRLYVGQINLLPTGQDGAARLRDFQRRAKYLFTNVETIATVGTPGYDGVHYSGQANQQLAFEQFRQLARDQYGSTDTLQINSPDIQKAFYNEAKDAITLVFDESMQMVWQADTTHRDAKTGAARVTRYLKDAFALDGNPWWVTEGSTSGNRVTLQLLDKARAKTIRYLPASFSDQASGFYNGPVLRNTRGMRAFSFDEVPLADALPAITTLTAKAVSSTQIDLSWIATAGAQTQLLERSEGVGGPFKLVTHLSGATASYSDTSLTDPGKTYHYRLLASNRESESAYSNVVQVQPLVLDLDHSPPLVQLYPIPLSADRLLQVQTDQVMITDLMIKDGQGRLVRHWHGLASAKLSIALDGLAAGVYLAELQTNQNQLIRRKVIISQ